MRREVRHSRSPSPIPSTMSDAESSREFYGCFVTGTDTGIGKTFVTAALVKYWRDIGQNVGAYKPAASGCEFDSSGNPFWNDVEILTQALGDVSGDLTLRERVCPQTFSPPLAPPYAARAENRRVDSQRMLEAAEWWKAEVNCLFVEGAGGLLSPLTEGGSNADFAVQLGLPLLVVSRLGLGTINHTLLTVEAAERRGLRVLGIVLNDATGQATDLSTQSNPHYLAELTRVPILGVFPHLPEGDLLRYPAFLRMAEQLLIMLTQPTA